MHIMWKQKRRVKKQKSEAQYALLHLELYIMIFLTQFIPSLMCSNLPSFEALCQTSTAVLCNCHQHRQKNPQIKVFLLITYWIWYS